MPSDNCSLALKVGREAEIVAHPARVTQLAEGRDPAWEGRLAAEPEAARSVSRIVGAARRLSIIDEHDP